MSKLTAHFKPIEQRKGMTPGLEPLACGCGQHAAHWQPASKKAAGKWMVCAVIQAGQKPRRVTTLMSHKEKAWEAVQQLCAGNHKSQLSDTTAPPRCTLDLRTFEGPSDSLDDTRRS
eukprot:TRINITY_DN20730_c0_g1_i1.p1 TRINITY_DN20730_c0_g1~~TRINITY_DN20730_c0_g1_i1.p1  ORF type:complete len:117 (+),score=6.52 TRINITY_DN20730_c0_g1_i1:265-615(+)